LEVVGVEWREECYGDVLGTMEVFHTGFSCCMLFTSCFNSHSLDLEIIPSQKLKSKGRLHESQFARTKIEISISTKERLTPLHAPMQQDKVQYTMSHDLSRHLASLFLSIPVAGENNVDSTPTKALQSSKAPATPCSNPLKKYKGICITAPFPTLITAALRLALTSTVYLRGNGPLALDANALVTGD
jgi:hypothetical protein